MRSLLLLSLALLIGIAPVAIVSTSANPEKEPEGAAENEGPKEAQNEAPKAALPSSRTSEQSEQKSAPKAPKTTRLIKLTPNQHPGSGFSIHEGDDDSSLLPDWPPALYARRLPTATVPSAPPAEPALSSEMRAGHLNLPPPAA